MVQSIILLPPAGGGFIDGFIRGEIADDFRVSAGPSRFEFEPIGFSFGARIGRTF